MRQDVEPDWVNYVHNNSGLHPRYGQIEIEFWGGDKLSQLIEQFVLDEYLFPESAQKHLRKTIALADQNEDDPRYFYLLIEEALFGRALPVDKTPGALRQRQKTFRLLNLSLSIVFHWCREAGNLRPALLAAEHMVLRVWDFIRRGELLDCARTEREFGRIFATYLEIGRSYAQKLEPHCRVRDGLFGYGADEVEFPLRTMEVIGILGSVAAALAYAASSAEDDQSQQSLTDDAVAVAGALAALIENNPPAHAPAYDEHIIDISIGLIALFVLGFRATALKWVETLMQHVVFAFRLGRHFPIATDAYEDLVALYMADDSTRDTLKQKLMQLSTLLPALAEWQVALGGEEEHYLLFKGALAEFLSEIDLQLWYPDETTDAHLYAGNAGQESGYTRTSIQLPPRFEELKTRIAEIEGQERSLDKLSCVLAGWPSLALISSRHFRTPIVPGFWQEIVEAQESHASQSDPS